MHVFYIRLRHRSDNVKLQSILGTYSHIMWVRTEVPEEMVIKIVTTPDLIDETLAILRRLKEDIEFEFL